MMTTNKFVTRILSKSIIKKVYLCKAFGYIILKKINKKYHVGQEVFGRLSSSTNSSEITTGV